MAIVIESNKVSFNWKPRRETSAVRLPQNFGPDDPPENQNVRPEDQPDNQNVGPEDLRTSAEDQPDNARKP